MHRLPHGDHGIACRIFNHADGIVYHMARRVLVSIDDSLPATAALEHALEQFGDDDITVLHVIDIDGTDGSTRRTVLEDAFETRRKTTEETADRLFETAREYAAKYGVMITTATEYGNPARRIDAYADENDIDQIVIGSHGRSGVSRLLLGSIAETVMRRSSIPVTTVCDHD